MAAQFTCWKICRLNVCLSNFLALHVPPPFLDGKIQEFNKLVACKSGHIKLLTNVLCPTAAPIQNKRLYEAPPSLLGHHRNIPTCIHYSPADHFLIFHIWSSLSVFLSVSGGANNCWRNHSIMKPCQPYRCCVNMLNTNLFLPERSGSVLTPSVIAHFLIYFFQILCSSSMILLIVLRF